MSPSPKYTISPLFGEIAMNLGLASPAEVMDALCHQNEQRSLGVTCDRIGQVLVGRGVLTMDDVTTIMEKVEERTRTLVLPGFRSLSRVGVDQTTLKFRGYTIGARKAVLLRILRFGLAESIEDTNRFLKESETLSRLNHPNVVKVMSTGELESIPYLVLEYVSGTSLRARLDDGTGVSEREALDILVQVASGLEHAHSLGIHHGGIMPAAVLLPRVGPVKLTDFALFDWCSFAAAQGAARMDSPYYLSPEQAKKSTRATITSDVYSLGATFFHMLAGRPPFCGPYLEVIHQHLKRTPPDPRTLTPGTSTESVDLVMRMLAKDPKDRPQNMDEVIRLARKSGAGRPERDQGGGLPTRLQSRRS